MMFKGGKCVSWLKIDNYAINCKKKLIRVTGKHFEQWENYNRVN